MVRSVWPRGARAIMALAGILALVAALALPAGAAANGAAGGNVPGNNGTVKIHQGGLDGDQSGGANDVDNDPHVCTFHIHGFFFDAGQTGSWWIKSWPPTGNRTVVLSGTYTANANGEWRDPPSPDFFSLPNGHYKLFVTGSSGSLTSNLKQKVFWVSCPTASPSPTEEVTAPPTEEATPTATQEQETQTPEVTAPPTEMVTAPPTEMVTAPPTQEVTAPPTESVTAAPTSSEEQASAPPVETTAPTQAVGGIQAGPQGTPPPTATSSDTGDTNSSLRIALFGLAMFLFAMAALAPKLGIRTRR